VQQKGLSDTQSKQLMERQSQEVLETLERECWIGPRVSTSLDNFFQPLYIGGALADDCKICLGDLFAPDAFGESKLQYVHDFGDWWSHTIDITRGEKAPVPEDASVAYLESGSGCCPYEDCGGAAKYAQTIIKLTGSAAIDPQDVNEKGERTERSVVEGRADPSRERWWKFLNSEIRGKKNGAKLSNPFEFDLEAHRSALALSLRQRIAKKGSEFRQLTQHNNDSGLRSSSSAPAGASKKKVKPTHVCAVCGVTAALSVCSGCHNIAFCSRAHQLEYWPKHKAACKFAQKKAKGK
jgi:hypothetical protein